MTDIPSKIRGLTEKQRLAKIASMDKVTCKSGDCWIWLGYKNDRGYGRTYFNGKFSQGAHRVSYILHLGEIPKELDLHHICNLPSCINPDHLVPVTRAYNTGQANLNRRTSPNCRRRLHKMEGYNLIIQYWQGKPQRACRECLMIGQRKWRAKRKLEALGDKE